ncbi:hypothetical protein RJ640_017748 [Escallonia rubra]|uniref:A20-type domain-containing protein n=1 Tax=Escallonia rubra TaxID=112253 RepID=A0AA88S9M8_9ASTE|nr:hypothetical protein RJ640_017748 [Escallonia rubra]
MAQKTEKEDADFKAVPEILTLCINNCGVTGSPATKNMCQKCFSASSSAASSSAKSRRSMISADMIDGLLAGAGYRDLSSELWQVARCLETVMVNAPTEVSHLANDAIHYNGTTHRTWPPGSTHSSPSSTSPKNRTRPINLLGSEPDGHRKLPTGTKIEEDSGIGRRIPVASANRRRRTGT